MNRVYCLYRVSDRGQVEKNDIPMQRIACRTFAQERGWEIEKELSEKGISGYKLTMQQRDAILEIREAALAGKFDILLVYMFDRIGRRDDETPFVVEWLTRNGIAVWSSVLTTMLTSSPTISATGRLLARVQKPPSGSGHVSAS